MSVRWWMPLVAGVGLVAIANTCLIATWFHVRPTQVEAHPYRSSAHEDERREAMTAFSTRGWALQHQVDATGVTLSLTGPPAQVEAATVRIYRPDAPHLDGDVSWLDVRSPVRVALPRPGVWDVHVAIRTASGGLVTTDQRILRPQ